jgi:hypothetical protein
MVKNLQQGELAGQASGSGSSDLSSVEAKPLHNFR